MSKIWNIFIDNLTFERQLVISLGRDVRMKRNLSARELSAPEKFHCLGFFLSVKLNKVLFTFFFAVSVAIGVAAFNNCFVTLTFCVTFNSARSKASHKPRVRVITRQFRRKPSLKVFRRAKS